MLQRLSSELASSGLEFRVVGGATGADLDIVVEPPAIEALIAALAITGCGRLPTKREIVNGQPCRVLTALGPLDIFMDDECPG